MLAGGIATHLALFRTGARGARSSLATVRRQGAGVPDGKGGITQSSSVVWGPQRVRVLMPETVEQEHISAGDELTVQRVRIEFPVDAGPFVVGDLVEVTDRYTARAMTYRILGDHVETYQTAQRLPAERVV